jgi:hypothetical protein
VLKKQYEYEEELFLALDGSATLNVNASMAALVALRGADLNTNPRSRFDRDRLRTFFEGPGVDVAAISSSRRFGRRFVHVSLAVDDVRSLPRLAPFAWSTYRFDRDGDLFDFRQLVAASAGRSLSDVGWQGTEVVGFRLHLPSKIPFHNAPSREIERGNILVWEQPLADRLRGAPIDIQVQMETQSILARTLLLFGATAVAALSTLAAIVWWVSRRGRDTEVGAHPRAAGPPTSV